MCGSDGNGVGAGSDYFLNQYQSSGTLSGVLVHRTPADAEAKLPENVRNAVERDYTLNIHKSYESKKVIQNVCSKVTSSVLTISDTPYRSLIVPRLYKI